MFCYLVFGVLAFYGFDIFFYFGYLCGVWLFVFVGLCFALCLGWLWTFWVLLFCLSLGLGWYKAEIWHLFCGCALSWLLLFCCGCVGILFVFVLIWVDFIWLVWVFCVLGFLGCVFILDDRLIASALICGVWVVWLFVFDFGFEHIWLNLSVVYCCYIVVWLFYFRHSDGGLRLNGCV